MSVEPRFELKSGPTALERLEDALVRMVQKHGFSRITQADEAFAAPLTALLLTEDPLRNPEVLDACVILPEALKALGDGICRCVAGPEVTPALMQRFGVARPPAVAFLQQGRLLGVLQGIRDWQAYQREVNHLLEGESRSRPVTIPVRVVEAATGHSTGIPQGASA